MGVVISVKVLFATWCNINISFVFTRRFKNSTSIVSLVRYELLRLTRRTQAECQCHGRVTGGRGVELLSPTTRDEDFHRYFSLLDVAT